MRADEVVRAVRPECGRVEADVDPVGDVWGGSLVGREPAVVRFERLGTSVDWLRSSLGRGRAARSVGCLGHTFVTPAEPG
jgi:hypothetical protein